MRTVKELIGRGAGIVAIAASIVSGGCEATLKDTGLKIERTSRG